MAAETRIDDWLERWEELKRRGIVLSAEEFLAGFHHEIPRALADEFKRRLLALERMDARLDPTQPPKPAELDALKPGVEPVPGYELVEQLGRGGFGEVWKARGPGGFFIALKFVPLDLRAGAAESRALELIREVRHPHLLATMGAWRAGGRLIIAMELAERTLLDRLHEAVSEGAVGIPAPEVHGYLREAAEGIDYLNDRHTTERGGERPGIQHRDIKPQNLLLVGGCVKVADFGLVRLLEGSVTGHTGSMTPAYAAPEFFRLETSAHSDQYSLAVTYCHLRGGRLPFVGGPAEVLAGHLNHPPDLGMLPAAERAAVGRALAKDPKARWPSCREFADALMGRRERATRPGGSLSVAATAEATPSSLSAGQTAGVDREPGKRPRRRFRRLLPAILVMLGAGVSSWYWLGGSTGGLLPRRDGSIKTPTPPTAGPRAGTSAKEGGQTIEAPSGAREPATPVVDPIVGKWWTRAGISLYHEFRPDGIYILERSGRRTTGRWSRGGDRVSFSTRSTEPELSSDRWVRVEERRGDSLRVQLEGGRRLKWEAVDRTPGERIAGRWEHLVGKRVPMKIHLRTDGHIAGPRGEATWSCVGQTLVLHWSRVGAPGGSWTDTCTLASDMRSYTGTNQNGLVVRGVKTADGP